MHSTERENEPLKVILEKKTETLLLQALAPSDRLKLFLKLNAPDNAPPPKSSPLTLQVILQMLQGVVHPTMLDQTVLEDVVKQFNQKGIVEARRIAKGKAAVQGTNGKLLLLVKKYSPGNQVEVAEEAGKVDLKNLHRFDNILKEQIVGRVYHPKDGEAGVDVSGKVLPAKPGNPAKITLDPSIIQKKEPAEPSYDLLVAGEDGYLTEENGALLIKQELSIKGDIDYSHGNLDFVGKIIVKGDVHPGFMVRAKRGLEVGGNVKAATLVVPFGSILIKGFLHGGDKSSVVCGENFQAKGVHEADLEVRGEILIDKEALNSRIRAQSVLRAPKAQLFGGETDFVCGVDVKLLGNESEVSTVLRFASDIEATTAYSDLQTRIKDHEKGLELIKLHLGPLAENPARLKALSSSHRQKMELLLKKLQSVNSSYQKLLDQKKEMLSQAKVSAQSVINVAANLFPGVKLKAGDKEFAVKELKKGPLGIGFNTEKGEFEIGAAREIVCDPKPLNASTEKSTTDEKNKPEAKE